MSPPAENSSSTGVYAERVFRKHPIASFTRFGDEGLLVVPRHNWNLVLNGAGARTFELLDGTRSVRAVAAALHAEYDAPSVEAVEADVAELVHDLVGRGALEEVVTG